MMRIAGTTQQKMVVELTVVASLIVAGCGSETPGGGASTWAATDAVSSSATTPSPSTSQASAPPTVGQTVTITTGPAPTLPPMPPEAQEMTNEGAEAFVRYWFDLANYAQATGDTDPLMAQSGPECDMCAALRDGVEASYHDGGRVIGTLWTLTQCSVITRRSEVFGVQITFDQSPGLELDSGSVLKQTLDGDHQTLVAVVSFHNGWHMGEIATT